MARKIKKSEIDNCSTYNDYFIRFCEMALNCYKWNNLPNSVNERYLEIGLLFNNQMCYFRDEVIGDLVLKCTVAGTFDVYGDPNSVNVYGQNGYTNNLQGQENFVIIYGNKMRTNNLLHQLIEYSARLERIDRTIDVNINAQKTPVLLTGEEKQMLALRNLYKQYAGNEPVIFGDKFQLSRDAIQAIRTDAPYMSDKLYDLKIQIWNEVLTLLGVSNVTTTKKERLITDEVNRALGGVYINRNIGLTSRELACKEINRKFGTNISVEFIGDMLIGEEDENNADKEVNVNE